MFASLSGIIGKSQDEVVTALRNYAISVGGDITQGNPDSNHDNFCAIQETAGNTTIYYPHKYLEWDDSSIFLSAALKAPVFSFHIHDGDLWMYTLYVNGEAVDQFNPIPDYWDEHISIEEINNWKGDAFTLASHIPGLDPQTIKNYLIQWNLDADGAKAYDEDEFVNEDWQLIDFMKKLGLAYPFQDFEHPTGQFYTLWTKQLRLQVQRSTASATPIKKTNAPKHWWKFWQK